MLHSMNIRLSHGILYSLKCDHIMRILNENNHLHLEFTNLNTRETCSAALN